MKRTATEVVREFGPFPDIEAVHGVTFDGATVWFASGQALNGLDPETGEIVRRIEVPAHAGTAFDGRHIFQLADDRIQRIDPENGDVVATIPAPAGGSGLAWGEGSLWIGNYRDRHIHEVEPETGQVLRTIQNRGFVTGVTWADGALWHATLEADRSDLRRIDPATGALEERLELPDGVTVSGLESDGRGSFFCGGATSGKLRVIRRRQLTAASG